MQLKDLRKFLDEVPSEFDGFELVNGEVGQLDEEDGGFAYRVDKPIIAMYIDENSNEICFFHQTQDDVDSVMNQQGDDNDDDPF
jgi:hypothetical protein